MIAAGYRLVLHLYPRRFRHEYGEQMTALLIAQLHDEGAARVIARTVVDLFVTVPKGEADRLKAELVSQQPLLAPLAKDQRIGVLRVTFDGKPVGEYPVLALEAVAEAGILARAWDTLRLWLK